jgi:hypothetical protein
LKGNGIPLSNGTINVDVQLSIEITFSSAISSAEFENAFSLKKGVMQIPGVFTYANASSKAIIQFENLDYDSSYQLSVGQNVIGAQGQRLNQALDVEFTTITGGIITELAPCITGTDACKHTISFASQQNTEVTFDVFSSFPITNENARWEKLTNAVIVIHGQNRDANDYFDYMMSALRNQSLEENTVLISAFFKNSSDASGNDLFWSNSGWREGGDSNNSSGTLSSFEVVDGLIDMLGNTNRFPVLKNIMVSGHSSGALFTHVYAASNKAESEFPNIDFTYVVANSQYFYYPDNQRIEESSGSLYSPVGCSGYNAWPLGHSSLPNYLNGSVQAELNAQFVGRSIIYLLGNGTGSDSSLNTSDCAATLLGSTRYKRGEHMFAYMEMVYPGTHAHARQIVNGIGHNGSAMYNSQEHNLLLSQILN